jgi:hypothetical protein
MKAWAKRSTTAWRAPQRRAQYPGNDMTARCRRTAIAAALCAATLGLVPARAEVQKFMATCNGQLCPYYRLVLTPPSGWEIDEQATKENNVQVIVPKGSDFSNAPALIYVQVFYHPDKKQTLEDFAKVSNARWQAEEKNAKITALATVPRANGKPGFLRFAFDNPDKPQQAYEVGAFGIDNDGDGNEFVLDVVMTGAEKAALAKAENDYIAFLKAH